MKMAAKKIRYWTLTGNAGTNPAVDFLGTTDNQPLVIKTMSNEALRIDIVGNIGISTANPQVILHVTGNRVRLESLDGARQIDLRADGAALDLQSAGAPLYINNGTGQPTFLNPTTGNVGVGTEVPAVKLHVRGDRVRLESGDGTRTVDLRADGAALDLESNGAPLFINNVTGQPTFLNPGGGNVGVGTTNPTARLTVSDTILPGILTDKAGTLSILTSLVPDGAGSQTAAVRGMNDQGHGVQGQSISHVGVEGTSDSGTALFAESQSGVGVWGVTHTGPFAGFFQGNVWVAGTLSKSGGGFTIDHPLEPATRYLRHSFVESPEMKNLYDGLAVLDAHGEAIVELPKWFEALNRDLRYQLTAVGAAAPNLHVAEELHNGRFKIAGGSAGLKVSWQVTGIRTDAWAKANPLAVEADKSDAERGRYLHPELYDQAEQAGVMWPKSPAALKAQAASQAPLVTSK